MNKLVIKNILVILFIGVAFWALGLSADTCSANNLQNWTEVLDNTAGPDGIGYSTDIQSPEPIIAVIIKTILSFLGVLFLILMIYGGFLWMTARGNEDQVTKSKNLIIAAVIGLIIILVSYSIAFFVIDALVETTLDF